ncbi:MAG: hypothetical protein IT204_20905 [Fimbriimonadaceae bacterium]|nr:hypothetical protein [Fimbriimonadaceae bacterium]
MIRVQLAPEPASFDRQVRQPGQQALARYQAALAAGRRASLRPLWTRCLDDLMAGYHQVCAYACLFIDRVAGGRSVEHFAPKSQAPELAYEWTNYRLVCTRMNARKCDYQDVLDPFEVEDGWFVLDEIEFRVHPAPGLPAALRQGVEATIRRLHLNDGDICRTRREHFEDFGQQPELLRKYSPFVAREAVRQGWI